MSLLSQKFKFLRKKDVSPTGHQITEEGGREWENFYRDRWSYDKSSPHHTWRKLYWFFVAGNILRKKMVLLRGKIKQLIILKHQMICQITNHVDALEDLLSLGIYTAHYA